MCYPKVRNKVSLNPSIGNTTQATSMTNMLLSPQIKPQTTPCVNLITHCVINELSIDNSLGNSTYKTTTPANEEILKMKNWTFHNFIGFLNYTSVLTNNDIRLGLPSAPRKPLSKLLVLTSIFFSKQSRVAQLL